MGHLQIKMTHYIPEGTHTLTDIMNQCVIVGRVISLITLQIIPESLKRA